MDLLLDHNFNLIPFSSGACQKIKLEFTWKEVQAFLHSLLRSEIGNGLSNNRSSKEGGSWPKALAIAAGVH